MRINVVAQDDTLNDSQEHTHEILMTQAQIAVKLIHVRQSRKESLSDVSQKTGVQLSTISRIENARTPWMTPKNVATLAQYYGIEDEIVPMMRKVTGLRLSQKRNQSGSGSLRSTAKVVGISHQRLSEIERGLPGNNDARATYSRFLNVAA